MASSCLRLALIRKKQLRLLKGNIMPVFGYLRFLFLCASVWFAVSAVHAQAPDVPIMRGRGAPFEELIQQANELRMEGRLLSLADVSLDSDRYVPSDDLPAPKRNALPEREIWSLAKKAHVRVGWHYLCQKCEHWHQQFAGGFFIHEDGLLATCQHVIDPERKSYREGYLIVATDSGAVYPVVDVLASNADADVAILRVAVDEPVVALPLEVNTYPGDSAWCYSDPLRRAGYFSRGMVNRFYYEQETKEDVIRMEVSTAWAPGSSGSAVLDHAGNAIGLVSKISAAGAPRHRRNESPDGDDDNKHVGGSSTMIVFRSAARAADVLDLTKPQTENVDHIAAPESPDRKE